MEGSLNLCATNYGTARALDYDLAVLPWGATEPHNLHLPYLTDAILSQAVALDSADLALSEWGVRCMVLPPVTFGSQNPGQRDLKFCIHTRYETQKAILTDIVASLSNQGMKKLVIINGHGGNSFKNMLRDLALDFSDVFIAVSEWYKVLPAKDYFDNPGDHADELETSVMMHYHPELVNLSEAGHGNYKPFAAESLRSGIAWTPRNWLRVTEDTGIGDPALATAEKGKRFVEDIKAAYARMFKEIADGKIYQD